MSMLFELTRLARTTRNKIPYSFMMVLTLLASEPPLSNMFPAKHLHGQISICYLNLASSPEALAAGQGPGAPMRHSLVGSKNA